MSNDADPFSMIFCAKQRPRIGTNVMPLWVTTT
jgi:hypothetical protein